MPIPQLSTELLLAIFEQISIIRHDVMFSQADRDTLLATLVCNRHFYALCLPLLYSSLRGPDLQDPGLLCTFVSRPQLVLYVHAVSWHVQLGALVSKPGAEGLTLHLGLKILQYTKNVTSLRLSVTNSSQWLYNKSFDRNPIFARYFLQLPFFTRLRRLFLGGLDSVHAWGSWLKVLQREHHHIWPDLRQVDISSERRRFSFVPRGGANQADGIDTAIASNPHLATTAFIIRAITIDFGFADALKAHLENEQSWLEKYKPLSIERLRVMLDSLDRQQCFQAITSLPAAKHADVQSASAALRHGDTKPKLSPDLLQTWPSAAFLESLCISYDLLVEGLDYWSILLSPAHYPSLKTLKVTVLYTPARPAHHWQVNTANMIKGHIPALVRATTVNQLPVFRFLIQAKKKQHYYELDSVLYSQLVFHQGNMSAFAIQRPAGQPGVVSALDRVKEMHSLLPEELRI